MNIDTAFKIAWAGFFHLDKITYMDTNLKKKFFAKTYVTKLDILFAKRDQYAMLKLKCSKTNIDHSDMQIMLAVTGKSTCLVAAL